MRGCGRERGKEVSSWKRLKERERKRKEKKVSKPRKQIPAEQEITQSGAIARVPFPPFYICHEFSPFALKGNRGSNWYSGWGGGGWGGGTESRRFRRS